MIFGECLFFSPSAIGKRTFPLSERKVIWEQNKKDQGCKGSLRKDIKKRMGKSSRTLAADPPQLSFQWVFCGRTNRRTGERSPTSSSIFLGVWEVRVKID